MRLFQPKTEQSMEIGRPGTMFPSPVGVAPSPVAPAGRLPKPRTLGRAISDEWAATAKAIGYEPALLKDHDLGMVLSDLGIPVYDYTEVRAYLDAAVKKLSGPTSGPSFSSFWVWDWVPLRQKDSVAYGPLALMSGASSYTYRPSYNLPVPLHALELVAKILPRAPEAIFSVTTIHSVPKGDPFLGVQSEISGQVFVIDQWDEPSFTGRAH